MNENYINIVRQSLYSNENNNSDSSEEYEEQQKINSKINKNIGARHDVLDRFKKEKMTKSLSNDILENDYNNTYEKKRRKKKETIDCISEKIINVSKKKKNSDKDKGELEDFDLNTYFGSREQSFNESIIEPHSGIDYEFLNLGTSNTKISSGQIYESCKDKKKKPKKVSSDIHHVSTSIYNTEIDSLNDGRSTQEGENSTSYVEPKDEPVGFLEIDNEYNCDEEFKSEVESIASELDETETNYTHFDRQHFKIIILKENQSISCYGFCLLKVLHGKLEVLGFELEKSNQPVTLYSPRGSSLLVLKNVTQAETNKDSEKIRNTLKKASCLKEVEINTTTVVFLCIKVHKYDIDFIENYIPQQIFPKMDTTRSPQIILDPKEKFNTIKTNPDWEIIIDSITSSTKLMIIGGKGVGKSTFVRYSINKLLNRFQKIRVIDLDPGQSEFILPGCISVLIVTQPVLGPNYTHLRKPERAYLSNISIGQNPKKYLKCVKALMDAVNRDDDLPTVINYMGFARNIGINIVSSAITYIKPTDIVQINSGSLKKNFIADITPNTVRKHFNLFGGDATAIKTLKYNLINISAMSDDNIGWSLEPRQVREMCILSYFGKLTNADTDCLTSANVPVYKIGLSSIRIVNDQGEKIPAAAVNANLVALSSSIERDQIFNIVGYGIVRGINEKSNTLYLITPEPWDVLKSVLYLVLTSVSLPPSIYMKSNDVNGCIPYVMDGELEALGRITKRSYFPTNKKL